MPRSTGTDDDGEGTGTLELVATTISTEDLRVARFIDRETPGNVGVALSGGGSRAATAAMGQLRALHELGLLDRVRAISGVSGGGWLAAAWTFLPQDRSDAPRSFTIVRESDDSIRVRPPAPASLDAEPHPYDRSGSTRKQEQRGARFPERA